MKDFISLIIFQFLFLTSFSQGAQTLKISGKVTDSSNNPVEYASIGILNKPMGTVPNSNGDFILSLRSIDETDTLKISLTDDTLN